jgi:hypothetical protein
VGLDSQYHRHKCQLQRAPVDTDQQLATTSEELALGKILCAVLLCPLSVISDQCTHGSLWQGEAPAEPKSIVSIQLSLFARNRSPGIPAQPPFAHTKPRHGARLPVAHPFPRLITTRQRASWHHHRTGDRWSWHWRKPVSSSALKPPQANRQRKLPRVAVCV